MTFLETAATMLGIPQDQIMLDLKQRLARADEMIKRANPVGNLMSTQVIASMIVQWECDCALYKTIDEILEQID